MTNDEFRAYIDEKLEWIRTTLGDKQASEEDKAMAKEAMPLYEAAAKMARYSTGKAFRRYRRNFERLLGGQK